jgi:hypothetical protein
MFGYVAERQRRSGWVILSLLLILAFAWWIAVVEQRAGDSSSILRLGLAVAVGLSLPHFGHTYMIKRRRRGHKDEARSAEGEGGAETEAEGQPTAEESPTEDLPRTYGEIFNADQPDFDEGGLPPWAEGEGWQAEDNERAEMETEGQPPAEELSEEQASPSEEGVLADQADLDGTADLEAIQADLEVQESLRRLREEFKARAKEAELRVKQRQAELDQAQSNPTTP